MEIRNIEGIRGIEKSNKINRVQPKKGTEVRGSDDVQISEEAKHLAEMSEVMKKVEEAPDIREDRVAEVKEKLKNGYYENNDEVMQVVAERILKVLGI